MLPNLVEMKNRSAHAASLITAMVLVTSCSESSPTATNDPLLEPRFSVTGTGSATSQYLLLASGELPDDLASSVADAGGVLEYTLESVGVAVASAANPDFASTLTSSINLAAVIPNFELEMTPAVDTYSSLGLEQFGNPPNSGDDDFFFDMQWGHDAIDAPEAWDAGARGAGVRIAFLDSGIDAVHPDLVDNLNVALSTSFVPGEDYDAVPAFPTFNHGTHVAGIAAAADNAFGTIGVAPEAEIVAIKIISAFTGMGSIGSLIAGLVYAAEVEADIANMSVGITMSHRGEIYDGNGNPVGEIGASEVAALVNSLKAAAQIAHSASVTMIASAGNAATNGDGDRDRVHVPSDLPHVISIAATAPHGWALDPSTDLDVPAAYTNYGQSVIDFAAPGGNFDPNFFLSQSCTITFITAPCSVFDLVWSPTSGGYTFALGTSMAAPHVTGVAALIIGQAGGSMRPAHVRSALSRSADDLGKPGNDDFYGRGRVNAANAVR